MSNTIQIKRGSGTPSTSDLAQYELAYDYTNDKLYIHDPTNSSGNEIVEVGGGGASTSGSNNQVLTDDGSGGITSEGSLTFNGSLLTNTGDIRILTGSLGVNTNANSANGRIAATSHIEAGVGSGAIGLTINDGGGNSNVTFNHTGRVPEQNGQAARIEVNTDATSTEGLMYFEVSSADVTSGSAITLPNAMTLAHDYMDIPYRLRHMGDTDTYLQFDNNRIRIYAGGGLFLDSNNTYLTSSGTAANSTLLNNLGAGSFLRSDANDTWSGNISTTSTNGIRFGNANQTDTNDGFIAAGRFASGLNIVGTQTSAGTGRQIRIYGDLIDSGGTAYQKATTFTANGMLSTRGTSDRDGVGDSAGLTISYSQSTGSNKPTGTDHSLLTMSYSSAWQNQIAQDWRNDGRMYIRGQNSGTWSSWHQVFSDDDVIPSANLDSDTAHLSGTQTFSGSKTFTNSLNLSSELNFTGNGNKIIDVETLANSNNFTIRHHNPSGNLFENAIKFTANAGAEIYYNGSKKFETHNVGASVTGYSAASTHFQLNFSGSSNCLLKIVNSGWSNETTHDILYNYWSSNIGDYTYLKSAGNSTSGHGIALVGDTLFAVGDTTVATGPVTNSATAPFTDTWFTVNGSGNAVLKGSLTLGSALAISQGGTGATNNHNARINLGLGTLAELNQVTAATIADNNVGADELDVSGDGTNGQYLASDGAGGFNWISPVSSTNAGTLDNLDSTQFLRSDTSDTAAGNITFTGKLLGNTSTTAILNGGSFTNLNTAFSNDIGTSKAAGLQPFRYSNNSSNTPLGGGGSMQNNANWGLSLYSHGTGGNGNYGLQMSGGDNDNQLFFIRRVTNGSFGSWFEMWHSGNDGTGSGLDADLLDGLQGSAYYSSSNQPDISDITGVIEGTSFSGTYPVVFNIGGANRLFSEDSITFNGSTNVLAISGNTVWHAGNDGAGSGLDADNLDGTTWTATNKTVRWDNGRGYHGNPRSMAIGYSGGNYGQFGYNIDFTTTSGQHTAAFTDIATRVDMHDGLRLYSSVSNATGGSTISWTEYLRVQNSNFLYKGNKIWHAGNDGGGSGLDADKVDGLQSSQLLRNDAVTETITSQNWNNFIDGTEVHFSSVTNHTGSNRPSGSYHYGVALSYSVASGGKFQLYAPETATAGTSTNQGLWYRTGWSSTYRQWARIWDSTNDGGGSGLDADLLDGIQGSSFLRSDATDTATGALTLNTQTWNGHITWNSGKNIYVGGESSFDVSGSGVFQIWDSGTGAPFIKCDVGNRVEIGQAGSRGLKVHGDFDPTGTHYVRHGGSDYSPNISFLGGSNVAGSNAYENATLGYYDNNGTGYFKSKIGRYGGDFRWVIGDAGGDVECAIISKSGLKVTGSLGVNVAVNSSTAGVIRAGNDVIAYYSSDERLKENVKPIDNALDKVSKIRGVEFDWIVNKEIHPNEGHDVGVIAQEIEKVLPEVVETRDSGYKAVKYEKIVSLLIEAVNEQQQQINKLEEKLNG